MKIGNFELKIGATVEAFLKDGDKYVSAAGIVPKTKGTTAVVEVPFSETLELWTLRCTDSVVIPKSYAKGMEVVFEPVAKFGKPALKKLPDSVTKVDPPTYYDAYAEMKLVPEGVFAHELNYRTGGGYVNVQWKEVGNKDWPDNIDPYEPSHLKACIKMAKTMDAYLGIPSVAWDNDNDRRKFFGSAGRFIPMSWGNGWHGFQYLSLSNRWFHFPQVRDLIFGNTVEAFELLMKDYDGDKKKYGGQPGSYYINKGHQASTKSEAAQILGPSVEAHQQGKVPTTIKGAIWYRLEREKKAA